MNPKTESLCLTGVDCNKGLLVVRLGFLGVFFRLIPGLENVFSPCKSGFRNLGHICSWNVWNLEKSWNSNP